MKHEKTKTKKFSIKFIEILLTDIKRAISTILKYKAKYLHKYGNIFPKTA